MEKITPKIIRLSVDRLLLDNKNPRLPDSVSHKSNQKEVWEHIKKSYDLR